MAVNPRIEKQKAEHPQHKKTPETGKNRSGSIKINM